MNSSNNSSNNTQHAQHQAQLQRRLQQVQAEEAALKQQLAVQEFAAQYPIQLTWPAVIVGNRRTDSELLQHRLLEAGLLYEVPTNTADTVEAASRFIANLEATDCFHAVGVQIGGASASGDAKQQQQQQHKTDDNETTTSTNELIPQERTIHVTVKEKNWYRLHAGAGLKAGSILGSSTTTNNNNSSQQQYTQAQQLATNSFLPTAEFELSAGLRNVAGVLDRTDLQYCLDTHNIGTWTLRHTRPLYTALPDGSALAEAILAQARGSQYHFAARASLDTVDHELVSNYKEYQRLVSVKAATSQHTTTTAATTNNTATNDTTTNPWYSSLEWAVNYRDLIPKRHPTLPYHLAASPEIVAAAGPSVKHSITAHVKYNQTTVTGSDDNKDLSGLPVQGVQWDGTTELATPPGDVGFVKVQAAVAAHTIPFAALLPNLSLHGTLATGVLRAFSFQGLCGPSPGPSDRFLLGGTGSFRGFVPAGIGPRSSNSTSSTTTPKGTSSSSSKMGDALGGDFFYTATLMASTSPPSALTQSPLAAIALVARHVRLFGFATAGTCCALPSSSNTTDAAAAVAPWDIFRSTRLSAGVGLATQALGPARLELTYAWPLRYGPRDGRRRFQFGVSFSL